MAGDTLWNSGGCFILKGVGLINQSPEITVALVLERFLASFLKGIAAGPIIASGMMYVIITTFQAFQH